MPSKLSHFIHQAFDMGILLKGLNGGLEIIGGILLALIKPEAINRLVATITQGELSQDPGDRIANWLLQTAHSLSVGGGLFGVVFLLSHGLIKLALIIALFKKKLWAYPLAMAVFALFIVYQVYRYALGHSMWMISLSVLDALVIALAYFEYQNLKAA